MQLKRAKDEDHTMIIPWTMAFMLRNMVTMPSSGKDQGHVYSRPWQWYYDNIMARWSCFSNAVKYKTVMEIVLTFQNSFFFSFCFQVLLSVDSSAVILISSEKELEIVSAFFLGDSQKNNLQHKNSSIGCNNRTFRQMKLGINYILNLFLLKLKANCHAVIKILLTMMHASQKGVVFWKIVAISGTSNLLRA